MKFYTTTTNGIIEAENANEAIEMLNDLDNAIEAIEVESEEDVYSESRTVLSRK